MRNWEREKTQIIDHYEAEIKKLKEQKVMAGSQVSQGKVGQVALGWISDLESERLRDELAFLKERSSDQ